MKRLVSAFLLLASAAKAQEQRAGPLRPLVAVGAGMQGSDVSLEFARIAQAGLRLPITGHAALAASIEYARATKFSGIDVCVSADLQSGDPCLDPPETESVMSATVSLRLHDVLTRGTRGYLGAGGAVSHTSDEPRAYARRTYTDPFFEIGATSARARWGWEFGLRVRRLSRFTLGGGGQYAFLWGIHW